MTRQTSLVVSAVVIGLWLLSFVLVLLASRRPAPRAARATTELRGESPAVVSLLVNNWEPGSDLQEAVLLDLVSQGIITPRGQADTSRSQAKLKEYEKLALDRAPLARLAPSVLAEAQSAGLWQQRFNLQALAWLGGGAAVAAVVVGVSVHFATGSGAAVFIALLTALTFGGLILAAQGMQYTAAGHEAAQHWLGVRVSLRAAPDLPELPIRALSEGDKWPAYGAALGVTHALSKELGVAAGETARPWSPQGGWHRVRVRYLKGRDHYGRSTVDLFQQAGLRFAAGAVLLSIVTWVPLPQRTWVGALSNFATIVGAFFVIWALYLVLRNVFDLTYTKDVSGHVVARTPWRRPGLKVPLLAAPEVDYLAVDDGRDDEIIAWAVAANAHRPEVGENVRLKVRPWSRRVI
jgi:hypothetical protein